MRDLRRNRLPYEDASNKIHLLQLLPFLPFLNIKRLDLVFTIPYSTIYAPNNRINRFRARSHWSCRSSPSKGTQKNQRILSNRQFLDFLSILPFLILPLDQDQLNLSMTSEAYLEKTTHKKEKHAEEVWDRISHIPALAPLLGLHEKIKGLERSRAKNHEYIEETSGNYQVLRKSIKDFAKTQNTDKKR